MPATKHSKGKIPLHLFPKIAYFGISKALGFGAKKYGDHNHRKGLRWTDLCRAAIGHIYEFLDGNDFDPESKLCHLYHAGASIAFLIEHYEKKLGIDDRYKWEAKTQDSTSNQEIEIMTGTEPETA